MPLELQMDKLRVFSAFAGYGTDNFALKQLGIPFECVGFSEIDKYAIQCFEQNHCDKDENLVEQDLNTNYYKNPKNYGDITKIKPEDLPDYDLFTGGFPCQSFSGAGKGLGELDPRGTLFYEIIRINEVKKPKYMLLENVKGLTSKKHKSTFDKIISELNRIGYDVQIKVLNTKDYGIPQNRERVFFVCYRNETGTDIGSGINKFSFPNKEELKIFIKDILEQESVDTKYYLKEHQINKLLEGIEKKLRSKRDVLQDVEGSTSVLCARDYKTPKCVKIKSELIKLSEDNTHQHNRVYDSEGDTPSLETNGSPKVFALRSFPRNGTKKVDVEICQNPEFRDDGCSNSLTSVEKDNLLVNRGIFRRLTPKECFRLQGFLKDEINLDGLSDTQRYKLCGNGQSVNVVRKIFERMFI